MYRPVQAKVHKETKEGTYFYVLVPHESLTDEVQKLTDNGILKGELRIDDGRTITADQRKKAHATIRDIANWQIDFPELIKEDLKYKFMIDTGTDYFSLSNCSITTARLFISYIIDFAVAWGVPLEDTLVNRTDDIDAAIYATLKHKKCICCGTDGEVHHWDAIGMGQDRTTFDDSGLRKICLCRAHHTEAHRIGRTAFEQKYHVYGIIYRE